MDNSYSDVDLQVFDIDWFGIDSEGNLGHFTSAGTHKLPKVVLSHKSQNQRHLEVVNALNARFGSVRFKRASQFTNVHAPHLDQYFEHGDKVARRGFYSFDAGRCPDSQKLCYFCDCAPVVHGLKIEDVPGLDPNFCGRFDFPFEIGQVIYDERIE